MSSAPVPATPELVQEPGLSEPQRIVNVFFSPTATFTDIRRNARWWVPFVITTILALGFNVVLDKKIGYDQVAANQTKLNPKAEEQLEQLPAAQQQQRLHAIGNFSKVVFGYGAPVIGIVFLLIIAAVLMGTFNFGLGTEISFKQALAVCSYSFLIRGVYVLLMAGAVLANSDPSTFNISNPIATNPAFFLSITDTPRFLYSVLGMIDLLTLWVFAMLGIGFAVVGGKKPSSGIAVMAGWWLVVTLCAAGLAAAFS